MDVLLVWQYGVYTPSLFFCCTNCKVYITVLHDVQHFDLPGQHVPVRILRA
jgi:hypothetical protein